MDEFSIFVYAFLFAGVLLGLWFVVLLGRTIISQKVVRWRGWVICTGLWLLVLLMSPMVCSVRQPHLRAACRNNLFQIGRAMEAYREEHGHFPPAYLADKDGRPLHSWRVLLLPYLDQEGLYKKLHLDEPWDSPHNREVFRAQPASFLFRCPIDLRSADTFRLDTTSYVMIVGYKTISDGPRAAQSKDMKDGDANTILLVEVARSGIHWAEPRDLSADEISYRVNDPDEQSISSRHRRGAHVLFADGRVQFLEDATDPDTVKALTTIAGGEDVSEFMAK